MHPAGLLTPLALLAALNSPLAAATPTGSAAATTAAPNALASGTLPTRIELRYAVTYGDAEVFSGHERFAREGGRYTASSDSIARGLAALFLSDIRRSSEGIVTATGLRPERYREDRGRRGLRSADLDWAARRATLNNRGQVAVVDLLPGTLDHASFSFSFMFAPPGEGDFRIPLTDGRRLKEYRYRYIGRERLTTPVGELDTVHYARVVDAGDDRSFDVWLAVDRYHLPARIRYAEGSSTFDSVLTDLHVQ